MILLPVGRTWLRLYHLPLAGALLASVAVPAMAQQEPTANAPALPDNVRVAPPTFMVNAYDVSGVTRLDATTIERALDPYVGPDRTAQDVIDAGKAIEKAYAALGYEAVQVDTTIQPASLFSQGLLQIRVTEVPVGQVQVTGSKYHSLTIVRDQVASIEPGKPLNFKALQADIAAANRFPDRPVMPSFKPGKVPGTLDVELKVKDSLPLHGSVELNNDHSPSTTPLRMTAGLRYSNLWQLGHTISGTYIVAPQDRKETEVFSGSYNAPIWGTPLALVVYGYKSNSNVAALGGTNVLGNGYQIGGRLQIALPSTKTSQSFSIGADFKNFDQNILVGGQIASVAPIRYVPLVASYSFSGGGEKSSLDFTLGATAGFRAVRRFGCFSTTANAVCTEADLVDQFRNKDLDANENFVHLNLDANYNRVLPRDFVAALKFSGQWADSHLVTNEQFAFGGLSTVRGYFQSEAVGDDGFAASLELRSPSLAPYLFSFVDELRVFGFYEGGYVRVRNAAVEQAASFRLMSAGGGARLQLFKHISGEISVGVPFRDGPTTRKGDARTTFTAKGEF